MISPWTIHWMWPAEISHRQLPSWQARTHAGAAACKPKNTQKELARKYEVQQQYRNV